MLPFSLFAGQGYGFLGSEPAPNFFYIKKYRENTIDHPVLSVVFYLYYLLFAYNICWKYIKDPQNKP